MGKMKVKIVLVFILTISTTSSLKILGLFPYPGESHFKFFHPIMHGLSEAGHDVTVVSHYPDKNNTLDNYKDFPLSKTTLDRNSINLREYNYPWSEQISRFFLLHERGIDSCELAFNSTSLQHILNSKPIYDVILLEQFNNDCMMAIAWKLNAPVIALSTCLLMPWHYDRFGHPLIPSYMPSLFNGYSEKMSFIERVDNWICINVLKLMYHYIAMPATDKIIQKYMKNDNVPPISELVKQTSLMFVNSHYSLSGSRPNAPNVVELGGVHIKEEQPLDCELKTFLDSATEGVIYVSWGSRLIASSIPDEKVESLFKAFGSFKEKILWKFENDTLPNKPENVFVRKWLPQREILCHPNVRVFVSHAGLMGLSEAVYCGVSVVVTPFFGDQFLNAAAVKARGIGIILHYEDITEDTMRIAINTAMSTHISTNAKIVSYSFRNRPMKPIDTAIWWVEHIAATRGAPLLKSHSTNLSAFIYYSFDVYITIAIMAVLSTALCIYIIRKMCSKIKKSKVD